MNWRQDTRSSRVLSRLLLRRRKKARSGRHRGNSMPSCRCKHRAASGTHITGSIEACARRKFHKHFLWATGVVLNSDHTLFESNPQRFVNRIIDKVASDEYRSCPARL
jgi:hypothetical protein